ncbi:MAG: hypothetical protein M3R04_02025 [bacterium]|nr:hypothetical protein [bacterium]
MLLLLALLPLIAAAQNSADAPPPEKKPAEDTEAAPNEATSDASAESKGEDSQDVEGSKHSSDRKKRRKNPADKEVTKTASAAEDGAGNVAEAGKEVSDLEKQVAELTEAGLIQMPSNNPAFPYLVQAQTTPEGQTPPLPPPITQFIPDSPNSAETRPGSGRSGNQAVSPLTQGIAEPATPSIPVDPPDDLAGEAEGYLPPQIQLEVPDIEMLPPPLPEGEYIQPDREYLDYRPLPALDETDTDEERAAANIESSLRMIDLSTMAQSGPVAMPLPPGELAWRADGMQQDKRNRKYILQGNAEVYYGDIAIWADLIEVNDSAASAYAKGYVAVQRQDDILYADEAYVNYDTKVLELFNVEGNTGGPKLEGTAYFFANRAYGTFDRMILDAVEITTCDPMCGSPKEVHISAHKGVYRARRSITISDVYFYVREHKVAYIPAMHIPIPRDRSLPENEDSDLQQQYGYNYQDGFFANFAYTYYQRWVDPEKVSGGGPLLGVAKLDLSQNRGPGVGIRQDLYNPNLGITTLRAYYQQDWEGERINETTRAAPERNLDLEFSQELNISKALQGLLRVNRKDIITATQTTVQGGRRTTRTNNWDNNFDLTYKKGDTTAGINAVQRIDITGGQPGGTGNQLRSVNQNTNVTLRLDQAVTDEIRFNASEVYTSIKGQSSGSGVPADQEGTFTASVNFAPKPESPLAGYTLQGRVQQQTDLDGEKNRTAQDQNRAIREELPSISIGLPPDLLGKGNFFNSFQINLDNLVTGTRRRPEAAFRAKFAMNGSELTEFSRSSKLNTRLGLAQYLYDDGNAQYVISPNAQYSYDSFNGWRFGANYDLQFQQGVRNPPVQGDAVRYRHGFDYNVEMTNYRSWRWRINSGFDLTHTPYTATPDILDDKRWYTPRPVSSTFTWDPNATASFSHTLSYDVLSDTWRPSIFSGSLRSPYIHPDGYYNWWLGISMTAETDYFSRWQTTALDVDWFKKYERGWSTEIIANFRPRSAQVNAQGEPLTGIEDTKWDDLIRLIRIRKENCCTTLELGWRVSINEVYVNAYLNALPQYPLSMTADHLFTPGDDDFFFDLAFPTQSLFNDVQQELFPGSTVPGLGLGGLL